MSIWPVGVWLSSAPGPAPSSSYPRSLRSPATSTSTSAAPRTCCPRPNRPYRDAEQALYDRLPVMRKIDRLRIFLYGELLTSGFVLSPKLLAAPMQLWRRQLHAQIAGIQVRRFDLAAYRVMPRGLSAAPVRHDRPPREPGAARAACDHAPRGAPASAGAAWTRLCPGRCSVRGWTSSPGSPCFRGAPRSPSRR